MKKLMLAIIAVVSATIMCFAMAACSSDVAGNTYVFDDIRMSYDSTVPEEEKATEAEIAEMKSLYAGAEITFEKDGTYRVSGSLDEIRYYKQDGDTVYIYRTKDDADAGDTTKALSKITVNGSKIESSYTHNGGTTTVIYKKK